MSTKSDKLKKTKDELDDIINVLRPSKSTSGLFDAINEQPIDSVQISEEQDFTDPYDLNTTGTFSQFTHSIKEMTPYDISAEPVKKRKKDAVDYLRYVILTVCVGVFVYSGYSVIEHLISYSTARSTYGDFREMMEMDYEQTDSGTGVAMLQSFPDTETPEVLAYVGKEVPKSARPQTSSGNSDLSAKRAKLERYIGINKDVVGQIVVTGTSIYYPLVQGKDNEYYLKYDAELNYTQAGSIFMDFRCLQPIEKNRNLPIYGHNMYDRTMFWELSTFRYGPQQFNNSTIEITTLDAKYIYEIFSFYRTNDKDNYIDVYFKTDADWLTFINNLQAKSMYQKDLTLTAQDRIITLSTCTNYGNGRYATHGRLIKIESDNPDLCFDINNR